MSSIKLRAVVALSGLVLAWAAHAEQKDTAAPRKAAAQARNTASAPKDAVTAEFEKFREMMEDASPAELFEAKGEELWKARRGPKNASLEQCDLGLGPGVLKGAYVQMPRYFADAGEVMDAERRIVYCMVTLQGFKAEDLAKQPFSSEARTPDPVSLVTYVAGQSRGMKIAIPQKHPKEREAYNVGARFSTRAGPGFLLRQLPRRGRQAHPHAGTAQSHLEGGRGARVPGLARLPHDRRPDAHAAMAHERLFPPAAVSRAGIRIRGHRGSSDLHGRECQRAPVQGPGNQALARDCAVIKIRASIFGAAAPRHRTPAQAGRAPQPSP
jgi:hypothetical protein